jgi:acyl-coenzyme A synthetase/AMP-(fatty) acid ligase
VLLWARPDQVPGQLTKLAAGLYRVNEEPRAPLTRPMWGTLTSGTSGAPKTPVGYADTMELLALQYGAELYEGLAGGSETAQTLATCLPLDYSAAFMMMVIPALYLRKDLLVFEPHDWRPLGQAAIAAHVACLTTPGLAAAGTASLPGPADFSGVSLFMASGYLSAERIRTIRHVMAGVHLLNCYGASETGVVSLDRQATGAGHVGTPIAGKPTWIEDPDDSGTGAIATSGFDCREFYWPDRRPIKKADGTVSVTDTGRFDEAGRLFLEGRLDSGEKLHGVTIYPRRIERHLLALDGVADVKVYVRQDGGLDRLAARVVGRVDAATVREHCAGLAQLEQPVLIECVPDTLHAYSGHGKL